MINTTNRKIDKKKRKKKDKRRRKPKAPPPRNHHNPPTKTNRSFPLVFFWGGDGWVVSGVLVVLGFFSSCLSSLFCSWGFLCFFLLCLSFLLFLLFFLFLFHGCWVFFILLIFFLSVSFFACLSFLFVLSWSCRCMDFNLVFVGGGGCWLAHGGLGRAFWASCLLGDLWFFFSSFSSSSSSCSSSSLSFNVLLSVLGCLFLPTQNQQKGEKGNNE